MAEKQSAATILEQIIGRDLMLRVCEELGGERAYIPLRPQGGLRQVEMQKKFRAEIMAGSSYMEAYRHVGEEFQLSVRRVQEVVNGKREYGQSMEERDESN